MGIVAWFKARFAVAKKSPAVETPAVFVPNRNFFSPEMNSEYAQGLRYTVRNEKLAACVREWVSKGWVQEAVGPAAKIHGQ